LVTMITLHLLAEDNFDQAMYVLTKNTELSRQAPGFVSRDVFFCVDDRLKGYSITTWETREDLENFRTHPQRPPLQGEGGEGAIHLITGDGPVLVFTYTDSNVYERHAMS
jgi:heme-degrading monooxygenase HmoA